MSRDVYGGRASRWDAERFVRERDRFEEIRNPRVESGPLVPRVQERSVDETYERRSGGGRAYEDDRYRERVYYDEPSFRPRRESVTIEREKEKEYYGPSPPRRAPAPPRPGLIRRQSSLDTFDRRPIPRYQREEYGPPVRREDIRPAYAPPPPRRYVERDFEEIKISEPDFYGDDQYRPYPERVREREIVRSRRRSRSRSKESLRSVSSSSSSSSEISVRKEFPKRGKTRMPARLVSVKAIIELGYPYEREGEVIIIQKALGPENIEDVIKLSESYKKAEKVERVEKIEKVETEEKIEMSGGRSEGGTVLEERREEVTTIPTRHGRAEFFEKTTLEIREAGPERGHIGRSRSVGPAPRIIDAGRPADRSNNIPVGPLVLLDKRRSRDDRTLRAEIRDLDDSRELVRIDQYRRDGRTGDLIIYDEVIRKERDSSDRIEIRKDKKAAQARALATMLKTLT